MNDVQVDLGTFEQIIEADDFAPPCDSYTHSETGTGSATWALRWASNTKPCGCARRTNPALMCDGCKGYSLDLIGHFARCLGCGGRYPYPAPNLVEALS